MLFRSLGTVGLDLVAALVATSLLRHRLGQRSWRAVHWLAYLCWPVAVLHSWGDATDGGQGWLRAVLAICVVAVAGCACWRISEGFGPRAGNDHSGRSTVDGRTTVGSGR